MTKARIRMQILASIVALLSSPTEFLLMTSPVKAWEENDKSAFTEKMVILKDQIDRQQGEIFNGAPKRKLYSEYRHFCLLQSIGIDVLHHYLEMNPTDQEWRSFYNTVRDRMTECLFIMYEAKKQEQGSGK